MKKLTKQQKEEIIKKIQEDKPISDEYRFLRLSKKFENENLGNMQYEELGNLCAQHGLVMYLAEPANEEHEWQKGNLSSDLTFKKVI